MTSPPEGGGPARPGTDPPSGLAIPVGPAPVAIAGRITAAVMILVILLALHTLGGDPVRTLGARVWVLVVGVPLALVLVVAATVRGLVLRARLNGRSLRVEGLRKDRTFDLTVADASLTAEQAPRRRRLRTLKLHLHDAAGGRTVDLNLLEAGRPKPGREVLERLADALDLPARDGPPGDAAARSRHVTAAQLRAVAADPAPRDESQNGPQYWWIVLGMTSVLSVLFLVVTLVLRLGA